MLSTPNLTSIGLCPASLLSRWCVINGWNSRNSNVNQAFQCKMGGGKVYRHPPPFSFFCVGYDNSPLSLVMKSETPWLSKVDILCKDYMRPHPHGHRISPLGWIAAKYQRLHPGFLYFPTKKHNKEINMSRKCQILILCIYSLSYIYNCVQISIWRIFMNSELNG